MTTPTLYRMDPSHRPEPQASPLLPGLIFCMVCGRLLISDRDGVRPRAATPCPGPARIALRLERELNGAPAPRPTPTVLDADELATWAHHGVLDRGGRPYIEHPRRVARMLTSHGKHAVMAGLLHDVVEDTEITLDHLLGLGYPVEVVRAVGSVSRQKHGEKYEEMLARAVADPIGRLVKLADNADNSDPRRIALLSEENGKWFTRKYADARRVLVTGGGNITKRAELAAAYYGIDLNTLMRDGYWDGPSGNWHVRLDFRCGEVSSGVPCERHFEHDGPCDFGDLEVVK